jgi:hypothetical protein
VKLVQDIIEGGEPDIAEAVKIALRRTDPTHLSSLAAFCARHDLARPMVSAMLHGRVLPSAPLIAALIRELGGTHQEWMDLLWNDRKVIVKVAE